MTHDWTQFISEALFYRILDDTRYTEKRLGYIPADDKVRAAIAEHVGRAVDGLAQALDSYEADVWDELMDDEITVKITNDYSDGHHSERTVKVDAPGNGDDLEEWFEEVVFDHTGDGHGTDTSLGSCYTAEVVEAKNPALVGKTHEWTD